MWGPGGGKAAWRQAARGAGAGPGGNFFSGGAGLPMIQEKRGGPPCRPCSLCAVHRGGVLPPEVWGHIVFPQMHMEKQW